MSPLLDGSLNTAFFDSPVGEFQCSKSYEKRSGPTKRIRLTDVSVNRELTVLISFQCFSLLRYSKTLMGQQVHLTLDSLGKTAVC